MKHALYVPSTWAHVISVEAFTLPVTEVTVTEQLQGGGGEGCICMCVSGNFRGFEKPTVRPQLFIFLCGSPSVDFLNSEEMCGYTRVKKILAWAADVAQALGKGY
jgi:hypothetical protein